VANVPGGSNEGGWRICGDGSNRAVARIFCGRDTEIRKGNYREFRARMITDNLQGLDGLTVGSLDLALPAWA